jgi:hypothetical protein
VLTWKRIVSPNDTFNCGLIGLVGEAVGPTKNPTARPAELTTMRISAPKAIAGTKSRRSIKRNRRKGEDRELHRKEKKDENKKRAASPKNSQEAPSPPKNRTRVGFYNTLKILNSVL